MNRKIPFLAAGFVLLGAGFASGYLTRSTQEHDGSPKSPQAESPANSRRAPRFTLNKRKLSLDPEDKKAGLDFAKHSLDALLVRYSRMTPEQLKEEIARLDSVDFYEDYNAKRLLATAYLSYRCGQVSPRQTLDQLKSMHHSIPSELAHTVIQGWAENNPEMAAAYFAEHRDDLQEGKIALQSIARGMGRAAPEKAMQWLAGLEAQERKTALPDLLGSIADSRPGLLPKLIAQLSPEDWKDHDLSRTLAAKWSARDWDAASQWIGSLPDEQKVEAGGIALSRLASRDQEKAMEEFRKLDKNTQKLVVGDMAFSIARSSPTKALEWLIGNTSEATASQHIRGLINYDSYNDSGLTNAIVQLPDGPIKDAGLSSIIARSASSSWDSFVNFEETLTLSGRIKNREKREESVKTTLAAWRRNEPEKARAWIEASSLPEELKKAQLEAFEK